MCAVCPAGTYGPLTGATSSSQCSLCPEDTHNAHTGSSSSAACVPCAPGYSSDAGAAKCMKCTPGSTSPTCMSCPFTKDLKYPKPAVSPCGGDANTTCCTQVDADAMLIRTGFFDEMFIQGFFGFQSNTSRASCVNAIQHASCLLCCGATVSEFYNATSGSLTLCSSSCAYLNSECGPVFNSRGDEQQQFCDWMVKVIVANTCPVQAKIVDITQPLSPFSSCLDLAAGEADDLLFVVFGILGSVSGLLAGLYYLLIATRFPNFSLFMQAFVASAGLYALANIATLLDTPHVTASVVIPVILAILPGVTAGYIAITVKRISVFIAGATIGLTGASFLLAAIQGSVVAAIHVSAQAVGLVLAALGVIIGGVLGCKFTDTILKINFAVLGATLLIVSISTFISGPQLNVAALFTTPLHYGCVDASCWALWAVWLVGTVVAAVIAVKFTSICFRCFGKAAVAVTSEVAATTMAIPLMDSKEDTEL